MDDEKDPPKKVGYKSPPVHTRWGPGQSGNPNGRDKGHKGIKTDLEAALNKRTTVKSIVTGEHEKGRNQEHAIRRLVERAALGDIKAQALLFPMIMQILGTEDRHTGPRKLSALDQEILAEVLGSRLQEAAQTFAEQVEDGGDSVSLTDHPKVDEPEDDHPSETENGDD
jgi:hypothetical protein